MPRVTVEDIPVGSRLAEPVLDGHGSVLLRVGSELTTTIITCLTRWQIPTVTIEGEDATEREERPSLPEEWSVGFAAHESCPDMVLIHSALRRWAECDEVAQDGSRS